jgi:hypothetical protein
VFIIGWLANKALGLRVAEEAEVDGICEAEHSGKLHVLRFGWWSWRRGRSPVLAVTVKPAADKEDKEG